MIAKTTLIILCSFLLCTRKNEPKLLYSTPPLVLTENSLTDGLGRFKVEDLPVVDPKCSISLKKNATPLTNKMWKIALNDVEQNMISNNYGTYFAAGRRYTDRVYTRDISFAGILGLNALYPQEMLQSLKVTRIVASRLGYKVSSKEVIKEINAPWEVITDDVKQVMAQYKSNSITRRTDDVVWIWAVDDLFKTHPEIADGKDYTGYNAALLARTMGTKLSENRNTEWGGFGSFHEKVQLPSGLISGSGQQLWTSAAFINICLRANLVLLNSNNK
ncbi:MAG: hypothetical protein NT144_12010 [Bacteroidia bacterium]|nr:hypothetical protein [Bacteroidia bacterium]